MIVRSLYKDESLFHRREKPIWLFQDNLRRVVPQKHESRPYCVVSLEYMKVRDDTNETLLKELGNWYRYRVIVGGKPSAKAKMIDLETDKSRFRVTIATSEYHPPAWRKMMKKRLSEKLGLKLSQLELVVPPREKTGSSEWVEGES